nr:hypothetical protein [Human alphaherpesvirus 2]
MSGGGSSKTAIDTMDSRARAASPAITEARRCSNPPAGPLFPASRAPRWGLPWLASKAVNVMSAGRAAPSWFSSNARWAAARATASTFRARRATAAGPTTASNSRRARGRLKNGRG